MPNTLITTAREIKTDIYLNATQSYLYHCYELLAGGHRLQVGNHLQLRENAPFLVVLELADTIFDPRFLVLSKFHQIKAVQAFHLYLELAVRQFINSQQSIPASLVIEYKEKIGNLEKISNNDDTRLFFEYDAIKELLNLLTTEGNGLNALITAGTTLITTAANLASSNWGNALTDLKETFERINHSWYADVRLIRQLAAITIAHKNKDCAIAQLTVLQTYLLKYTKKDWHIAYASVEALADIIKYSEFDDVRKMAWGTAPVHSESAAGTSANANTIVNTHENYTQLASFQDFKRDYGADFNWRIRQIAGFCYAQIYEHSNEEFFKTLALNALDVLEKYEIQKAQEHRDNKIKRITNFFLKQSGSTHQSTVNHIEELRWGPDLRSDWRYWQKRYSPKSEFTHDSEFIRSQEFRKKVYETINNIISGQEINLTQITLQIDNLKAHLADEKNERKKRSTVDNETLYRKTLSKFLGPVPDHQFMGHEIDEAKAAITSLIHNLALQEKPVYEFLNIYKGLPYSLRPFFYEKLRKTFADPYYCPPESGEILQAISYYPQHKSGIRPVISETANAWENEILFKYILSTTPNNYKVKLICEYPNVHVKEAYLDSSIVSQLIDSNTHQFKDKPSEMDGKSLVFPIYHTNQVIAYAKIYPERPAREIAVNQLCQLISGHSACVTVCQLTLKINNEEKCFPVLISRAEGSTLKQILSSDPATLNDKLEKLDSFQTSLQILERLIFAPQDDKLDNITLPESGRLLSIDTDQNLESTVEIESSEHGEKLKLISLFFCLPQMMKTLDEEAVALFLQLNPEDLLTQWLDTLQAYTPYLDRLFPNESCKQLATKNHSPIQLHSCFIPMDFASGMATDLITRWLQLIGCISKGQKEPLRLLWRLFPRAARYYEEAFEKYPGSSTDRFNHLPIDFYIIKPGTPGELIPLPYAASAAAAMEKTVSQQVSTSVSQILRNSVVTTIPQVKDYVSSIFTGGWYYGPVKIKFHEISPFIGHKNKIQRIKKALECEEGYNDAEFISAATPRYIQEIVINQIDFQSKSFSHQQRIIQSLMKAIKNPRSDRLAFSVLRLAHCQALTDDNLITLLNASSGRLQILDLRGCKKITSDGLSLLHDHDFPLEMLNVSRTGIKKLATPWLNWALKIHRLIHLDVSGAEVREIKLDSPRLTSIVANDCPYLTHIETTSTRLSELNVKYCSQLTAEGLRTATTLVGWAHFADDRFECGENQENLKPIDTKLGLNPDEKDLFLLLKSGIKRAEIRISDSKLSQAGKVLFEALLRELIEIKFDLYGKTQILHDVLTTNCKLQILDLSHNIISPRRFKLLCDALKTNHTLTNLSIRSTFIGDDEVLLLSPVLSINSTITTLSLACNIIGDKGAKSLARALFVTTLKTLDLSHNRIYARGLNYLCDAVSSNQRLAEINSWGNPGFFAHFIGVLYQKLSIIAISQAKVLISTGIIDSEIENDLNAACTQIRERCPGFAKFIIPLIKLDVHKTQLSSVRSSDLSPISYFFQQTHSGGNSTPSTSAAAADMETAQRPF